MTRAAWLTDIHLEFLRPDQIEGFVRTIAGHDPDVVMISGDISTARYLRRHLIYLAQHLKVPVCFVLGNHDFYGSDIPDVHTAMRRLTAENLGPIWLPEIGIVELAPGVALVGHDGWSDGRYGNFTRSNLMLNDYVQIKSLSRLTPHDRLKRLQALGDEGARYLEGILKQAVASYRRLIVLTHPPPFQEACWHEGKQAADDDPFLPHFTCKAIGDVLRHFSRAHPAHEFTVLCGHTHGSGEVQMYPNLRVITGGAEYEKPVVQRVLEF